MLLKILSNEYYQSILVIGLISADLTGTTQTTLYIELRYLLTPSRCNFDQEPLFKAKGNEQNLLCVNYSVKIAKNASA